MLALIAICLPIFLVFAAYSLNVAYMQMTRTELRTATDAASRAGARKLSLSQDTVAANTLAIEAARRNSVAGDPLLLRDTDLVWGFSEPDPNKFMWKFKPAEKEDDLRNALRVIGSRTASSRSGSIPLLFSQVTSTGVFEPSMSSTATQLDRDICLVLDTSGSMTGPAGDAPAGSWTSGSEAPEGSKWLALVDSVNAFLLALERTPQDEQVALVTYASSSQHERDLTMDYNSVSNRMDDVSKNFYGGATAVGDGAATGVLAVTDTHHARRFAAKTIVILTDGNHNTGQYPDTVATNAHNDHGITVHTIAFGNDANETLMRQTAENGGGQYWKATTPESLTTAFEEIANNLPTLLTE